MNTEYSLFRWSRVSKQGLTELEKDEDEEYDDVLTLQYIELLRKLRVNNGKHICLEN